MNLTATELLAPANPAKTQGESTTYQHGYCTGLAEGIRVGMERAAKMCGSVQAHAIRAAIPQRKNRVRGKARG